MTQALAFVVVSLGLGGLLSIPGVALGFWLQRTHRGPNNYRYSIAVCMALALITRIWFRSAIRYDTLALIAILASTLGVYSMDIYWAVRRDSSKE